MGVFKGRYLLAKLGRRATLQKNPCQPERLAWVFFASAARSQEDRLLRDGHCLPGLDIRGLVRE